MFIYVNIELKIMLSNFTRNLYETLNFTYILSKNKKVKDFYQMSITYRKE